jgi:hypothetical protein
VQSYGNYRRRISLTEIARSNSPCCKPFQRLQM